MVTHDCDTCEGAGEVLTMVPGSTGEPVEDMVECPDCGGEGCYRTPDAFERLVGPHRAERIRRPIRRARRRIKWARARWDERNADTVAAVVYAHRNILDDHPRLRAVIDGELAHQLGDVTPLHWRTADVRWCIENAKRAARGQQMLALPWEDVTDVRVNTEHRDYFERGLVAIVAERRRQPRA